MAERLDRVRARLAPVFRRGIPDKVAALRAALDDDDDVVLRRLAHRLRGSAASFGYPAVSVAAAAVEEASAEDRDARLAELLEVLGAAERGDESPTRVLLAGPGAAVLETTASCVVLNAPDAHRAEGFLETLRFDAAVIGPKARSPELLATLGALETPALVLIEGGSTALEAGAQGLPPPHDAARIQAALGALLGERGADDA